jgi:N-acetylneuraminic acid mutarotase
MVEQSSRAMTRLLLAALAFLLPACGGDWGRGHHGPGGLINVPVPSPWTWIAGTNATDQSGAHGTKGVSSIANYPGGRQHSVSWTNASGHFVLFGGYAFDSAGTLGYLNDLWAFDGSGWAWLAGPTLANTAGSYGVAGMASTSNIPGGRAMSTAASSTPSAVWLFGGDGYDETGTRGALNDLWKFDGSAWTWVNGSKVLGQAGTYGVKGTPSAANVPGARYAGISWVDGAGNFWIFGGLGYDSAGLFGNLNDLWHFNGAQWTWVAGSNVRNQAGTYGTKGVPSAANTPGAREGGVSWTDSSGNLWLFGGMEYDQFDPGRCLNDLWRFDGASWTWVSGSNAIRESGVYGTQGTPSAATVPGARVGCTGWIDGSGAFWVYAGYGFDTNGGLWYLNDLWKYDGSQWTWFSGGSTTQQGVYGTKGVPGPGLIAGSRQKSLFWLDPLGRFWIFGGYGYAANGLGDLNDLWVFEP